LLGGFNDVWSNSSTELSTARIVALNGNFTEVVNAAFLNLTKAQVGLGNHFALPEQLMESDSAARARIPSATSGEAAKTEFDRIFKFTHDWTFGLMLNYYNASHYSSEETTSVGTVVKDEVTAGGRVYAQKQISYFSSLREIETIHLCVSNWTVVKGACNKTTETYDTWYLDQNACPNAVPPVNETGYCDGDGNGLIGTASEIDSIHFDIVLEINDKAVNYSKNYTNMGWEKVEIIDEDTDVVVVEFGYDFDEAPLNLKEIGVEIQGNNNGFGYTLVNGLDDIDKTVKVERILNSDEICIEDRDVGDVDDISDDCGSSSEYYIDCPGRDEDREFNCTRSGDFYIIKSLDHSGVREIEAGSYSGNDDDDDSSGCTPLWNCGDWSDCVSNQQTRTCTDTHNCGTTAGRPALTNSCTSLSGDCTPSWDCDEWTDCIDEEQTRTCTDTNSCGTSLGKPISRMSCEDSGKSNLWIIIAIVFLVLLVIIIAIVLFKILKRKSKEKDEQLHKPVLQRPARGFYQNMHYGGESNNQFGNNPRR
jgi:hypothetical protein